jgi:hypothetical protein
MELRGGFWALMVRSRIGLGLGLGGVPVDVIKRGIGGQFSIKGREGFEGMVDVMLCTGYMSAFRYHRWRTVR